MAHGADVPDIKIYVQYGMFREPTINMVWQRLGRAARGPSMNANFIWCVESLYFSSEPQPRMTPRCNHHHELQENEIFIDENLTRKSDRQKRAELPPIIYQIINSSTCARRSIVLHYYPEELVTVPSEQCCSICDPTLALKFSTSLPYSSKPRSRSVMLDTAKTWLDEWCRRKFQDTGSDLKIDRDFLILPDDLKMICDGKSNINPGEGIQERVARWKDHQILGEDLDNFLQNLEKTYYAGRPKENIQGPRGIE